MRFDRNDVGKTKLWSDNGIQIFTAAARPKSRLELHSSSKLFAKTSGRSFGGWILMAAILRNNRF
jgi:hypothetical protein